MFPVRRRARLAAAGLTTALLLPLAGLAGTTGTAQGNSPSEIRMPTSRRNWRNAENEGKQFQLDRAAYYESRRTAGEKPLTIEQASSERAKAAKAAKALRAAGPTVTSSSVPAWSSIGPKTVQQVARTSNTLEVVSGRVSSLAVNSAGRIYLGAAQGGVWSYDPGTAAWTPLTDDFATLSVGAIAIAPG